MLSDNIPGAQITSTVYCINIQQTTYYPKAYLSGEKSVKVHLQVFGVNPAHRQTDGQISKPR